jgi:hypothetical protein
MRGKIVFGILLLSLSCPVTVAVPPTQGRYRVKELGGGRGIRLCTQ